MTSSRRNVVGVLTALCVVQRLRLVVGAYTCESGETTGEVQGETGSICAPRCVGTGFTCPLEVPPGTTAQPQCMLQDVTSAFYCGLLCTVDSQCPSGAACKRVGSPEVSMCVHPLSFKDWALGQSTRTKLAVGFPTATGTGGTRGFELAKAYAALQSLKRRYAIADGDADVLTVKELLATASASAGSASAASGLAAGAPNQPGGRWAAPYRDFSMGAWSHDLSYATRNLESGLPGIEREIHDTIWNVEHITNYGVATELLRGILFVALVYFGVGCVYRNQSYGSQGLEMLPHKEFWIGYPALVMDGVTYAMMLLGAAPRDFGFGGSGGAPAGGLIGRGSADRDTFSNFEPFK
mmetsp:Transcript_46783/g.100167  ORF Transcript_46783/g.100167 Transcript_46783/m.100167 type:complete len:352 (+) Transcript_46783:193-1248(+)